eukprot:260454-Prorocentrum_lima.AAC.1
MVLLTGDLVLVLSLGLGEVSSGGVDGLDRSPLPAWPALEADRTSSHGGVIMSMRPASNC